MTVRADLNMTNLCAGLEPVVSRLLVAEEVAGLGAALAVVHQIRPALGLGERCFEVDSHRLRNSLDSGELWIRRTTGAVAIGGVNDVDDIDQTLTFPTRRSFDGFEPKASCRPSARA